MPDNPRRGRGVTGGATPQNKVTTPGENRGAKPTTDTTKPTKPPSGGSGVTSSGDNK